MAAPPLTSKQKKNKAKRKRTRKYDKKREKKIKRVKTLCFSSKKDDLIGLAYGPAQKAKYLFSNNLVVLQTRNHIAQAQYFRKLFDPEDCRALAEVLLSDPEYWQMSKENDKRGTKPFLITGEWNCPGKFRYKKDKIHPAGKAGKKEVLTGSTRLNDALSPFALTATKLVQRSRPELHDHIVNKWKLKFPFGVFHLFMSPNGIAEFHRDSNDLLSFLFVIKVEGGKKGGIELGGLGVGFKWDVGDALLLDSKKLEHGVVGYEGIPEDRLVGLFIIHRFFLYLSGVTIKQLASMEDIEREAVKKREKEKEGEREREREKGRMIEEKRKRNKKKKILD